MKKKKKQKINWTEKIVNLITADGYSLDKLSWASPLFKIRKNDKGIFEINKTIVLSLAKKSDELYPEYLKFVFFNKDKADQECFKMNKLRFDSTWPDQKDYKGNYQKALRIIADWDDKQLFEFVKLNFKNP